ncbi:TPA: hypothetical protein VCA58_000084 [Streptococcus pyogenes]|uniref:hypothetical protein n=1 Tax=Streptococcus pyogenes TaxID=1314 RepID=UPI0010D2C86E|nr:hypothetical protein [Streptococcus pyogenes]VGQ43844.1 hypothetical membrane associated protein [Streptococcus pyogenes]VGQ45467.1 hypothetical membrane associated protein [Streptococcus pyogenes]VGQ75896.1 hypothetical membrane associated protein [Streptococcus pyogenes]VGU86727.1 Uncharacterised protein [Streptococcus pyogenes]VHC39118.1 Uncharacterised protein [Streptococcus pyogenes]
MKTKSKRFLKLATLCLALLSTTLLTTQPVKAEAWWKQNVEGMCGDNLTGYYKCESQTPHHAPKDSSTKQESTEQESTEQESGEGDSLISLGLQWLLSEISSWLSGIFSSIG